MQYLTGAKKWSFNGGPSSVNIDLSGWTGMTYIGGYCGGGKIILPNTIRSFGQDAHAVYYLDNPANNFDINVSFCRQCPVITNNTKNYNLNVSYCGAPTSYYKSLFTLYLINMNIQGSGMPDSSGVDYTHATNLSSLTINNHKINNFNFDLLPDSLTNLSITNCEVKKIASEDAVKIESVNFSNNNIASVSSFIGAEITTLNLKNNNLSNYETILETGTTKLVTQILAEIKGLKNI